MMGVVCNACDWASRSNDSRLLHAAQTEHTVLTGHLQGFVYVPNMSFEQAYRRSGQASRSRPSSGGFTTQAEYDAYDSAHAEHSKAPEDRKPYRARQNVGTLARVLACTACEGYGELYTLDETEPCEPCGGRGVVADVSNTARVRIVA